MSVLISCLNCRWERPTPKSTAYWKEICNNIEKQVRRVRNPIPHFPFISLSNNYLDFDPHDSAEFNNLSKVQFYEEPIVKISPPTPSRKSSFKSTTDAHQNKNTFDKKYADLDKNLILKLRSLIETRRNNFTSECDSFDKTDLPKTKIYTKKTCHHKNEPSPPIFDDDLNKFLPRRSFSVQKLFNKNSVEPNLRKTVSRPSSLQSSDSKKVDTEVFEIHYEQKSASSHEEIETKVENEIEKKPLSDTQKTRKIPKLGKASLLASFAKTVSIPSSIETHESSDEDYSKSDINIDSPSAKKYDSESKSKKELRSSQTLPKDYLRVPKLGYASLHPSFRKLVPIDSFPDQEETINYLIPKIVSEYSPDSKSEENQIDSQNFQTSSLVQNSSDISLVSSCNIERKVGSNLSLDKEKAEAKSVKLPKKQNYSTRYAYRALKLITENKNLKFAPVEIESEKGSSESSQSSSSSSLESEYTIRTNRKSIIEASPYRNFRDKLRRVAPKYLGQDYHFPSKNSESEIKTIISTTRSTSGVSPVFQISELKSKTLTSIPSIKIYPRKKADKCLPCLYKSFKKPEKVKHELPMAILSSVIKEPFNEGSESDTSSVSLPDLKSPDFESVILDRVSNQESNLELHVESSKSEMTLKKEADKITKFSDNDNILSKEKSLSPKTTDLKKVSIISSSVHSSDLSKPSTPSGQSSESEDARPEVTNELLNTSKYLAPCHAPVVWKPSLESLRALRLRKATSMQSRASAITSKSDDDSDLDDSFIDIPSVQDSRKQDRKVPSKTVTIQSPDLKMKSDKEDSESNPDLDVSSKDKRKKLTRTKTIAGKIGTSALELDKEKKARFVRAQTSLDLRSKFSDARKMSFFDIRESSEDLMILKEDLLKFRQDSKVEESLCELSKEEKEVLEILERFVEEDESPGEILKKLCDWYSKRVSKVQKNYNDPDLKKALNISINLLRLLAESRRYLNSDKLSPDLEFSSKQPPLCNSRQLRRILPLKSYNLVAPILNMPLWHPKRSMDPKNVVIKKKERRNRRKSNESNFDLIVRILISRV